jgi:hypothetical protein
MSVAKHAFKGNNFGETKARATPRCVTLTVNPNQCGSDERKPDLWRALPIPG